MLDLRRGGGDHQVLIGLAAESKAKGWWHAYGDVVPSWFELYVGMEQGASHLRHYAPSVIPGLLQNREYAEAAFRILPEFDEDDVQAAVAVRLKRQNLLKRRNPRPPQFDVLIEEGALRRRLADIDGLQRQLAYLVDVSQRPRTSIRVLPATAGFHRAMAGGEFTILDFPSVGAASPEPTTIYSENLTGALYLDRPSEVETYNDVWKSLEDVALGRRGSDDLIATIIKELDD